MEIITFWQITVEMYINDISVMCSLGKCEVCTCSTKEKCEAIIVRLI